MIDFVNNQNRNFIVYKKDLFSLLSSFSWLHSHGSKDKEYVFLKKYEKLKTKKLSLTCGYISTFVSQILNKYEIPNRLVSFITMDKWNTYDNGHALIEVKIGGKWILFDIDNNRYFLHKKEPLNLKSFLEKKIDWREVEYKYLSTDHNLDAQNFGNKKLSYHAVADYINNDLNNWYKRVMQCPMILKDGVFYISKEKFSKKLLQYYPNLKVVPQGIFIQKFYGEINEYSNN